MKELANLQKVRLAALLDLIEKGRYQGKVPGEDLHNNLIFTYAKWCWGWGWIHGRDELARINARIQARRFGPGPNPAPLGAIPNDAIAWAAARVELQGKWNRDLDQAVNDLVVKSLIEGWTNKRLATELRTVFPAFSKRRLENIARTETMSAYNAGRMKQFRTTPLIVAYQFSAVLDARTSNICRARNGKMLVLENISEAELAYNTPPLHYMCRSVLVPVDKYAFEDLVNGDPNTVEDFFGWVENGPRNLNEATDWRGLPAPLPGFGAGSTTAQPRPTAPRPAPTPPPFPRPVPAPIPQPAPPAPPPTPVAPPAAPSPKPARTRTPKAPVVPVTLQDFADFGHPIDARMLDKWNKFLPGIKPAEFFGFVEGDYSIHRLEFDHRSNGFQFRLRLKHPSVTNSHAVTMVRDFSQTGRRRSVEHSLFQIDRSLQKSDLAKKMLAKTVGYYQASGIYRVTVHANIDVGSYAWARYGFRLRKHSENPNTRSIVMAKVRRFLGGSDAAKADEAKHLLALDWSDDNPDIFLEVARSSLGKSVMMNLHWYGELKLQDRTHMETFWNYTDPSNVDARLKGLKKKRK